MQIPAAALPTARFQYAPGLRIAPIVEMLTKGVNVGLGVDGSAATTVPISWVKHG